MSEMSENETIQRGIQLAEAGHTDQAREIFEAVVADDPNNATAWAGLAQLARNPDEELFALRQVLRVRPDNDWATGRLAEIERGGSGGGFTLGRRGLLIGSLGLVMAAALALTVWAFVGLLNPSDSEAEAAELPTVTLYPTFTPPPTITPLPEPTDPPRPTSTPAPTPTEKPAPVAVVNQPPPPPPTKTPSPTEEPEEEEEEEEEEEQGSCSDIVLAWEKTDKLVITNNYGTDIILTKIYLEWPKDNDKLKEITLDGAIISDKDFDDPKATVNMGPNDSPAEKRTVSRNKTGRLAFGFKEEPAKKGYTTKLTFDVGCKRSASL